MHTLNRVVKTGSYHKANVITDLQRLSLDGMVKRSVLLKQVNSARRYLLVQVPIFVDI